MKQLLNNWTEMTTYKRNLIVIISFILVFILVRVLFGAECVDGFASQSIGSRGACSHHGGVSNLGSIFAWIASFAISFILVKCLKITITSEEVAQVQREFKNRDYDLNKKICYRCGGRVVSMKYKNDKFPYWACKNIAKNRCDTKPIKKFL